MTCVHVYRYGYFVLLPRLTGDHSLYILYQYCFVQTGLDTNITPLLHDEPLRHSGPADEEEGFDTDDSNSNSNPEDEEPQFDDDDDDSDENV